MPVVKVLDADVSYQVDGRGPALVLVHGTGGNSETNWGHLVEQLSADRTVIRPDYSGSGETTDKGSALTVELLANQVVAAAKDAGATSFDLAGFSLGATVAAYIAAKNPDLIRSLTLLAGFATSYDSRTQLQFGLWKDLAGKDHDAMARLVMLTGFSPGFLSKLSFEEIEKNIQTITSTNQWEGMLRQIDLDLTLDISNEVKHITQPTLVIGCTQDQMVPIAHARFLASAIPQAIYAELESGHLAPLECGDKFVELLTNFLEKTSLPRDFSKSFKLSQKPQTPKSP